jgi:hypothetical protein
MTKLTISTVRVALREVGVVIKRTDYGEFRVNFRQAGEATAYYTGDLQDAHDTGLAMAFQNRKAVPVVVPADATAREWPFARKGE